MARIIKALKSCDAHSAPTRMMAQVLPPPTPAEISPAAQPDTGGAPGYSTTDDDDATEHKIEEKVFFIEVGGPDRRIDASPEVLAFSPRVPKKKSDSQGAMNMTLPMRAETAPPCVTFQPWPCPDEEAEHGPAPELIVYHDPESPLSQQYYQLLEKMLSSAGKAKVFLFTAHGAKEGVTTALLNLALAACHQSERKVVVVDKNWQDPAAADRLGLTITPGLQEVLSGSVALESALQTTQVDNLHLLASGEVTSHDSGMWTTEALRWIIRWLHARYDLILLDAPAWDDSDEFAALLSICECVFPVVSEAQTSQPQLHQMIQDISEAAGNVRGVVYNNPR